MPITSRMQGETRASAFVLKARDIEKSFGATHVLRGANLRIRSGDIYALLGVNGAGKSTMIRIISGSHRHDGGTIDILIASAPSQGSAMPRASTRPGPRAGAPWPETAAT
ncbi:ATP-binding cassette domain-containing protein [Bradyrhizobium oligotrophicum]|uniref:ATP-binding cassette domain-containing protein n=1 Tax=Bradyrhizobium oligotrophicum TaxID=44255 RepID=UPI003EC04F22